MIQHTKAAASEGESISVTDRILCDFQDGLLTITLNMPDRRNGLNTESALELLGAVQMATADATVRAVLLRGAGGTFCVGGDVKKMAGGPPPDFEAKLVSMRETMQITRTIHTMSKPVVVAVDGAAAGAGLSIALAADFRIVGESAKLTTAFAKLAVSGDYGGLFFLSKLIGSAKARELALLSPVLSGDEAFALGLATKVVADAEVQDAAHELAARLARGPTVALGYIKANINNAENMSLDSYLEAEALHHCRCLQTEDYKEAARAFVEKRPPAFRGHR